MITKAFTRRPVFGGNPFMIMGGGTSQLPALQGAVLLQGAVPLQVLRAAAGDAEHPHDGEDADVSAETACEILHKALPRKRFGPAQWDKPAPVFPWARALKLSSRASEFRSPPGPLRGYSSSAKEPCWAGPAGS